MVSLRGMRIALEKHKRGEQQKTTRTVHQRKYAYKEERGEEEAERRAPTTAGALGRMGRVKYYK
jgi:hypothetical protein